MKSIRSLFVYDVRVFLISPHLELLITFIQMESNKHIDDLMFKRPW